MEKYMKIAFNQALKAYKRKEVPVGAVIEKNGKIIAKSRNTRQKKHILIGHAEINCILKAEKKLKDWRLDGCNLYVTLAPCEMCSLLIKESRINNVFYLLEQNNENSSNFIRTNDCKMICEQYKILLNDFFDNLRK